MINVVLVGLGHIAKRHAEAISNTEGIQLYGVCDAIDNALLAFETDGKKFTNLDDVLQDDFVDVVVLTTPSWLHHSMTLDALNHDKVVLCEKPLALTSQDVNDIIKQSLDTSIPVWVILQQRYAPAVQYLEQLLSPEKLGTPHLVQINCLWNRGEQYFDSPWKGERSKDGGALFNQFSHYIDLVTYLFGSVYSVSCITRNFNHPYIDFEDSGVAHFTMESGALVTLNYTTSAWDKNFENSITVIASEGNITLSGQGLTEVTAHASFDLPKMDMSVSAGHKRVYEEVVRYFWDGACDLPRAVESKHTTRIIEALYESAETHQEVIV